MRTCLFNVWVKYHYNTQISHNPLTIAFHLFLWYLLWPGHRAKLKECERECNKLVRSPGSAKPVREDNPARRLTGALRFRNIIT